MNAGHVVLTNASLPEALPLWNDNRVWWVNCVAVECAWSPFASQSELPILRQRRDALLGAFINNW
jgi:hypothetical protein